MTDKRIVILENDTITVWFHERDKIVHHEMHKYTHGDNFRNALRAGLEAMKEHGAKKWLSDNRANGALPKDDEEWAKNEWFPETVAAGWKYWAIVKPEKVIGQLNIARFVQAYAEQGITAKMFSEPGEAMQWLKNPD